MTESSPDGETDDEAPKLLAHGCANGHLTYPAHTCCPSCGEKQVRTVDLTAKVGSVLTWTTVASTPPGVREPNTLAIVEFTVEAGTVRVLGGTTDDVTVGENVQPIYVEQLRDPEQSIRKGTNQPWDGFRFEPV